MGEFALSISREEAEIVMETIRKIADEGAYSKGAATKEMIQEEYITSWEIAEFFWWPHTRVFNQIAKFIATEATGKEKEEFKPGKRKFGKRGGEPTREHPIWKLTEAGCKIYIEKVCIAAKRNKAFIEGLKKFNEEMSKRFHGAQAHESNPEPPETILAQGRSRTECGYDYLKQLFDRFIDGPALENREIEELRVKYEEFYRVLAGIKMTAAEVSKMETAMMDVAIEAEMQGFIYGFKVFEALALANRISEAA